MQKIVAKIAGAGTGLTAVFIWLLVVSKIDWFEVSETLSNPYLWLLFFGYGLPVALIVEVVIWKFQIRWRHARLVSYIVAGFLLFYVFGINAFAVIASIITAAFAFIFYIGEMAARYSKPYRITFAFVLPVVFLLIAQIDFTVKREWEEQQTAEGYEAQFRFFHGEHRVPIKLKKGEFIAFTIQFNADNEGGYGHSFEGAKGCPTGMEELGGDWYGYEAEQDGVYYIVLSGYRFSGRVSIDWEFKRS